MTSNFHKNGEIFYLDLIVSQIKVPSFSEPIYRLSREGDFYWIIKRTTPLMFSESQGQPHNVYSGTVWTASSRRKRGRRHSIIRNTKKHK